jgi:hypothetical protein
VESLERLVVHVEEAVRLATMADESHLRLGLMLLDSAAELMMYRECERRLQMDAISPHTLHEIEQYCQATGDGAEALPRLRQMAAAQASQRKRVSRDFSAKCDYLLELGLLPGPHARVLKKLHRYRNETYHRDHVRRATLESAARIYIYLVCTMMKVFTGHIMSYPPEPPVGLIKYLPPGVRGLDLLHGKWWGLQPQIASQLLTESGITRTSQLGTLLAQHVAARIDGIESLADHAAFYFCSPGTDLGWDLEAVLGLAQLAPRPDLAHLPSSDQARTAAVPVSPAQLARWRADAEALASQPDDLTAFAAFADLEDAFEPVEALMRDLAGDIEWQVETARAR